jgi:hypothetical protein
MAVVVDLVNVRCGEQNLNRIIRGFLLDERVVPHEARGSYILHVTFLKSPNPLYKGEISNHLFTHLW